MTAALGFAFEALARDSELRHRVRADPQAMTVFLEELLRVQGPVPSVPRVTTAAVDVDNVTIPAGANCWLMMGRPAATLAATHHPTTPATPA